MRDSQCNYCTGEQGFRCASCEEGLYLYPYDNGATIKGEVSTVPFPMNVCVSDCPSFDSTTVNDPEDGTCSYLGAYASMENILIDVYPIKRRQQHYYNIK